MPRNDVVIIELDRPRELRFGNKAIKKLEKMINASFFNINTDNLSAEEIEKILFCGLMQDAADQGEILKLEQMEDLLDLVEYGYVIKKFSEAFEAAFGVLDKDTNQKNLERIALEAQKKKGNGPGKNR